jgi:RAQPRD family integrative conjugative element protein
MEHTRSGTARRGRRRLLLCAVLACSLTELSSALAIDVGDERVQLAVLERQLDLIDRLATQAAHLPREPQARYHFDYGRLHADVERIRIGINGYLMPERAQPSDPGELLGEYRAESAETP